MEKELQKNKKEINKGVVFKVQIATSSKKLDLKPENFKGVKGVAIYEAGGLFRYVVGQEPSITGANRLQLSLREQGFKDAFIVAFFNGKRVSISKALQIK